MLFDFLIHIDLFWKSLFHQVVTSLPVQLGMPLWWKHILWRPPWRGQALNKTHAQHDCQKAAFSVLFMTREEGRFGGLNLEKGCRVWYTDGSKTSKKVLVSMEGRKISLEPRKHPQLFSSGYIRRRFLGPGEPRYGTEVKY